jgi:hypothetical protein
MLKSNWADAELCDFGLSIGAVELSMDWWKLQEYERSVAASEEEEAVAKCALKRANTPEEEELAASALRKARANSDELENKILNAYDDTPSHLCDSVASLLIRMRENKERRGSGIEPF